MHNFNEIKISGAREHNLKNVSVKIPRNKLVVITGLSGSGKSTLACDVIYAEVQRRYAESFSSYARQFLGILDKPDVDQIEGLSPTIAIDQRTLTNNPRSTVGTMTEIYDYLRLLYSRLGISYCLKCNKAYEKKRLEMPRQEGDRRSKNRFIETYICPGCGKVGKKIEPRLFSFNSPYGACPRCKGLGVNLEIDPNLLIPNKKLSLAEGAIHPWSKFFVNQPQQWSDLEAIAKKHRIALNNPVRKLKEKDLDIILYGDKDKTYAGIANILQEKHIKTTSDYMRQEIEKYMREINCPGCNGKRLNEEALNVLIEGKNIYEISSLPLDECLDWFNKNFGKNLNKKLSEQEIKIVGPIISEIIKRFGPLLDIGLGYLTLYRSATTLSGGEAQRIRIANQANSELTGVVYILDEPSIGLHNRDVSKLIKILMRLKELNNTVIVVEHDESIIKSADYIIDMGPGAGAKGGKIIAEGNLKSIMSNPASLTAHYLNRKTHQRRTKYNEGSGKNIEVFGATEHNLKNVTVQFPLGKLICVTGVSGSGKSTLVNDILARALAHQFYRAKDLPGAHKSIKGVENINKIIRIDQSPIGRTPRSNPATYTGIFTYVRNLFSALPEAVTGKYDASSFSFNVDGGRCRLCNGEGYVKVEMQFLQDVYAECESCGGRRYNDEILNIYYKNKNIADILDMSVEEALSFFSNVSAIYEKLKTLMDVGLGYLPLGQSATTLSGGEAQRIKLATELSRRATGKTLYILDEPTTGLHFENVKQLLTVLKKLVELGNTIIIVEHNLDVIREADWIIDMGPEGGKRGGELVAAGRPVDIMKVKKSYTGKSLSS